MEVLRIQVYRCDICGKESEWITGKWIAHVFLLTGFEHEFHVCGDYCDKKLTDMSRKERTELARKIVV
jgi:hypothetical protein